MNRSTGLLTALIALAALSVLAPAARAQSRQLTANGSSQIIQNVEADRQDLTRMVDAAMIARFAGSGFLVPVHEESSHYQVDTVASAYRYTRPWTKLFLDRLSTQYSSRFGKKLRVTSLVRSVDHQKQLARRNGNAAEADGPKQSSHLTGATIDISKRFMSAKEQRWMRNLLVSLKNAGYLYAIEERQQPVFHVMVYKNYPEYVRRLTRAVTLDD
jgi:hypothetical protein